MYRVYCGGFLARELRCRHRLSQLRGGLSPRVLLTNPPVAGCPPWQGLGCRHSTRMFKRWDIRPMERLVIEDIDASRQFGEQSATISILMFGPYPESGCGRLLQNIASADGRLQSESSAYTMVCLSVMPYTLHNQGAMRILGSWWWRQSHICFSAQIYVKSGNCPHKIRASLGKILRQKYCYMHDKRRRACTFCNNRVYQNKGFGRAVCR